MGQGRPNPRGSRGVSLNSTLSAVHPGWVPFPKHSVSLVRGDTPSVHTHHTGSPCLLNSLCGHRILRSSKAGKELEVHPSPGMSPDTLSSQQNEALWKQAMLGHLASWHRWDTRGQPGSPCVGRVQQGKGSSLARTWPVSLFPSLTFRRLPCPAI